MSERIVLPLPLLLFGEISAHDISDVVVSVAQDDWDQIVAFNTNGENTRGITPDYTNNHIVIGRSGVYALSFNWSGFGPANPHDWDIHIAKNNRAVTFNNFTSHFRTPTAQNLQSIMASGILKLLVNDTIELWVQRLSAGSNIDLTTTACTLNVLRISKQG